MKKKQWAKLFFIDVIKQKIIIIFIIIKKSIFLYHKTAERFLNSILTEGLKSINKLYVHMSDNIPTAINVGSRHGKPVVLRINTGQMYSDEIKFY